MAIRTKLLLSFGIMMLSVFVIGISAIWSLVGWNRATSELSMTYNKSVLSGRLRTYVFQQVQYGEEFLEGHRDTQREFESSQKIIQSLFSDMRGDIKYPEEGDHIKGLEETQFELAWIINGIYQKGSSTSEFDFQEADDRLQEIADEITDDVAALNQYYRAQENKSIQAAAKAGNIATAIIAAAAIVALIQLIAMTYLLRSWLVRPITVIGKATREISNGNLDLQLPAGKSDEWAQLASDINRMATSLKISQQRLLTQERLAALGEIASYTAHNLRNPLAGIRAAAQVTLTEDSSLSSDTKSSLLDIIGSVDRLDLWIKRFLAFAKPLNLSLEKIDINDLLSQVVLLAQKSRLEAGIQICWTLAADLPSLSADLALLEQAISAIISNAFEAAPSGSIIEIKTHTAPFDNGEKWIMIIVSDEGKGIAPQIRSRLFQPFVTNKDGGTGLGLAQAKKIINLHGGEISLENGNEKGTVATIRLPIHSEAAKV